MTAVGVTPGPVDRPLWLPRDAGIAIAVMVIAGLSGTMAVRAFVAHGNSPVYYQDQFAPAVLSACGLGFRNPPIDHPGFEGLAAFLAQRQGSLDCASLPSTFVGADAGPFQLAHRYLLGLVAAVWGLLGVSWSSIAWISGAFFGVAVGLSYLFFRVGATTAIALPLSLLWASSPLHLSQLPQLRDYAKAPFFVFMLCMTCWAATSRASRATTIGAMAMTGVILGLGFGIRTDAAIYLPLVLVTLLFFRPEPTRPDVVTRVAAAAAAIACFLITASPILRVYQSANSFAHVALLGLTDQSRDWLQLQPAPYSYGYLYDDGYVATAVAARVERAHDVERPVLLSSPESIQYANEYYGRLLRTFPGDVLTRAWAAVRGALALPFLASNGQAPAWTPPVLARPFAWRDQLLSWAAIISPLLVAVVVVVMLGGVSARLGLLAVIMTALLAGTTSVQFHDRHIFQLEILPLWAFGAAVTAGWALVRRGTTPRAPIVWRRALATAALLALVVVVPVSAARRYQQGEASALFASYESAATEPVTTVMASSTDPLRVTVLTQWRSTAHARRFVDSDVLVLELGGGQCDVDAVAVTYRYRATLPYSDLTRNTVVPIAARETPTRVFFPVYTLGDRMGSDALSFVGLELLAAQAPCLLSVRRFARPEEFPVLIETVLDPDWRRQALHESLQQLESPAEQRATGSYGRPEGLLPRRSELPRLQAVGGAPSYRSPLVTMVTPVALEFRGTPGTPSAYLVSWAPEWHAAGSLLFVEGEIAEGGLTLGLQRDEHWVEQLNVDRTGPFRATIRVDSDGPYAVILANHLTRSRRQRASVTRYGWLPPTP